MPGNLPIMVPNERRATASFLPRETISTAAPGLYVDIFSSLPPINSFKFLASTKAWFCVATPRLISY